MKLNELMEKYGDYEVKEGFMDLLEKPKPKSVWDLKCSDTYYYIDPYGDISDGRVGNDFYEDEKFSIGNVFLTKSDAEFEVERLKVISELKKYAKEFSDGEWKDNKTQKYYIVYRYSGDYIRSILTYTSKDNVLYFESPEKAQEAIDAAGEERIKKYYFGVKG